MAYWWLEGYVEFSDEQRAVRDDLARLHLWTAAMNCRVRATPARRGGIAPGESLLGKTAQFSRRYWAAERHGRECGPA